MSTSAADHKTPATAPRRLGGIVTLPMLIALAWIVYELTAQPALAAVLLCLKFGWEEFHTAWWLRRRDPIPGRGRACFWLYTSWGLWKAVLAALVMMVVTTLVYELGDPIRRGAVNPKGPREPVGLLVGAIFTVFFGLMLSCATGAWGYFLAWRNRVRLWLNGSVYHARVHDIWPPHYGEKNHLPALSTVMIFVTFLVLVPTVIGVILAICAQAGVVARGPAIGLGLLATVLGGAIGLLLVRDFLAKRFAAEHPDECWPVDENVELELA